jgi:DNA polymerase-1
LQLILIYFIQVRIAPRDLFVARPGHVLLSCDYAQMEMRLLASLAGDAQLREFFRGGRDIHREVYAHWKCKAVAAVTDEERETAKRVVYALMYGMGPSALTGVLRCSLAEARHFLSSFLSSFPAVRVWMERVAAAAERDGFCLTIAGRRRLLPPDQARHLAVNSIVQGSAADIMKQALIELHRRLAAAPEEAILVSTIHDEVVLEVRCDALERVRATVVAVLETCGPGPGVLAVPLVATSCVGPSLGRLK